MYLRNTSLQRLVLLGSLLWLGFSRAATDDDSPFPSVPAYFPKNYFDAEAARPSIHFAQEHIWLARTEPHIWKTSHLRDELWGTVHHHMYNMLSPPGRPRLDRSLSDRLVAARSNAGEASSFAEPRSATSTTKSQLGRSLSLPRPDRIAPWDDKSASVVERASDQFRLRHPDLKPTATRASTVLQRHFAPQNARLEENIDRLFDRANVALNKCQALYNRFETKRWLRNLNYVNPLYDQYLVLRTATRQLAQAIEKLRQRRNVSLLLDEQARAEQDRTYNLMLHRCEKSTAKWAAMFAKDPLRAFIVAHHPSHGRD